MSMTFVIDIAIRMVDRRPHISIMAHLSSLIFNTTFDANLKSGKFDSGQGFLQSENLLCVHRIRT
jgi:hypothetical protein